MIQQKGEEKQKRGRGGGEGKWWKKGKRRRSGGGGERKWGKKAGPRWNFNTEELKAASTKQCGSLGLSSVGRVYTLSLGGTGDRKSVV